MVFSIKYRGKSGEVLDKSVEAANRTECVAQLKSLGIVAISIQAISGATRNEHTETRFTSRFPYSLVLAIFLVGILGGSIWLWFDHGKTHLSPPMIVEKKAVTSQDYQRIKTETVPASSNAQVVVTNMVAPRREQKTYIDSNGIERYPGGMRVRKPAARTVKIEIDPRHRFKHVSEAQIAGLLEIKPGSLIVGEMKYSYRFVEDFKKSLEEKIEILDTDSEYDKQLKRDVIEAKKQLKNAMDRGEDIAKIMTDTRNELRELGKYRESLKQDLQKLHTAGEYSEAELEELTVAANKVLKEKGCRPIKIPTVLIRYIREKKAQAQQ